MICFQCGNSIENSESNCPNCGVELTRRPRNLDDSSDNLRRISQQLRAVPRVEPLLELDTVIDERFVLTSLIDEGPWGQVYEAHDNELDTEVALKVFRKDVVSSPDGEAKFVSVTRAARSVSHANVARLLHSGMHEGHPWVAMQLLEGMSLRAAMDLRAKRKAQYSLAEIGPVFTQIVQALAALESCGCHGNLRPENVILLPDIVKLTDYYIFAALSQDVLNEQLSENAYLAPEVIGGSTAALSVQSDVYSLGVMMRELLLGSDGNKGLVEATDTQTAVIDAIIRRATSSEPDERHATMSDLYNDFATVAELELLPPSPSPMPELDVQDEEHTHPDVPIDQLTPPVDDELATTEISRDEATELIDLLATTEVNRDQFPGPAARSGDTKTVVDPAHKHSPITGPSRSSRHAVMISVMAVIFVALVVVIWALSSDSTEEFIVIEASSPEELVDIIASDEDEPDPVDEAPELEAFVNEAKQSAVLLGAHSQELAGAVASANAEVAIEPGESGASGNQRGGAASPRAKTSSRAVARGTQCPDSMALVRSRAGNFCIDTHEFPGKGKLPSVNVNWFDARRECNAKGQRLCKLNEWRQACGRHYPYGNRFDPKRCNTVDEDGFERTLAKTGSFAQCRNSQGLYDMSGNVYEWVEEQQVVGGGFDSDEELASCRYASPKAAGSTDSNVGFRCCATPQ